MNRLQTVIAKTALLAAAAVGLSACVGYAPEPVYYQQPAYYGYYPEYYAPRPAQSTFIFSFQGNGRSGHHNRGHNRGHGYGQRHHR